MVGWAYVVLIGQVVGLGHLFEQGGEPSVKLSPPLSLEATIPDRSPDDDVPSSIRSCLLDAVVERTSHWCC